MTTISQVAIANLALTPLGADNITAIDEDSENARKVNAIWDLTRDSLLGEHPWNFAIKQSTLGLLSATPTAKYSYFYSKPSDYIRAIGRDDQVHEWQLLEGKIASNSSPLTIEYIARISDVAAWSAGFIYAFASKLKADLTYGITNSRALASDNNTLYETIDLPKAKAMDAQEGEPLVTENSDWITIRT